MRSSRRRKGLSIDGSVAGVNFNRHTPGLSDPVLDAFSAQSLARQVPASFHDYDPSGRMYDFAGPEYQVDPPWWEGSCMRTPELRFPPAPTTREPEALDYETSIRQLEMIEQITRAAQEEALRPAIDPTGPSFGDLLAQLQIPELTGNSPEVLTQGPWALAMAPNPADAHVPEMPMASIQDTQDTDFVEDTLRDACHDLEQAVQEMESPALSSQLTEGPADPIATMQIEYEQMISGLETIVQQAMPEEPDPFDEQQRLFEMHMQQMMSSFGPMGPML